MAAIFKRLLVGTQLLLLLGSCAVTDARRPFDSVGQVWPAAPEMARIAFVGEFSVPSDLGIRTSFLERLLSFTAGSNEDLMLRPMDIAVAGNSSVLYVADSDRNCVHRYDLQRKRYACLTLKSSQSAIAPVGLAVTEEGWLFVADSTNGRLYRVDPGGKELEVFYVGAVLKRPTGIFWDSNSRRLYVTDTVQQSVLVFDETGNLKQTISERGETEGRLNFPTYLWVDSRNDLLVSDSLNFRVQRFNSDGEFLFTFGKNGDRAGDFSRPKGIATDSFGNIYVIDALMHALQIFNRQGELLLSIGGRGQGEGEFWLPNGIFITPDNMIFVADTYNKRVQVFRYIGPPL